MGYILKAEPRCCVDRLSVKCDRRSSVIPSFEIESVKDGAEMRTQDNNSCGDGHEGFGFVLVKFVDHF